ncbi:MAG: hypothetical protein PT120_22835 [Aphanizomenon gracile PMC649.10]|nr:hypothetical protein [Aphanizomenon gracile PMC649.10]
MDKDLHALFGGCKKWNYLSMKVSLEGQYLNEAEFSRCRVWRREPTFTAILLLLINEKIQEKEALQRRKRAYIINYEAN